MTSGQNSIQVAGRRSKRGRRYINPEQTWLYFFFSDA
jgi:hypothetical protein